MLQSVTRLSYQIYQIYCQKRERISGAIIIMLLFALGASWEDRGCMHACLHIKTHTFQVNTQAVLITDGESSFTFFLYENPVIIQQTINVRVGFNAGEGRRRTDVLDSLGTVNVFQIDGKGRDIEPSDERKIQLLQGSSMTFLVDQFGIGFKMLIVPLLENRSRSIDCELDFLAGACIMKLVPGEGEVVADPCACSATQQTSCCPSTLRERGFERGEGVYRKS